MIANKKSDGSTVNKVAQNTKKKSKIIKKKQLRLDSHWWRRRSGTKWRSSWWLSGKRGGREVDRKWVRGEQEVAEGSLSGDDGVAPKAAF